MYFGGVKVVCAVQCGLWNMDAKMDLSQDLTMWHLHTIKYWAQCPVWNVWCREVLQCPVLCAAVALFTLHSVAESKKRWLLTALPLQRGDSHSATFQKDPKEKLKERSDPKRTQLQSRIHLDCASLFWKGWKLWGSTKSFLDWQWQDRNLPAEKWALKKSALILVSTRSSNLRVCIWKVLKLRREAVKRKDAASLVGS